MERQFSAQTLEAAYELAAKALGTSVINLEVTVVQKPKAGFFGLFRKDAIIIASVPKEQKSSRKKHENSYKTKKLDIQDISEQITTTAPSEDIKLDSIPEYKHTDTTSDNFYKKNKKQKDCKLVIKQDPEVIIAEVREKINSLFADICFEIDDIDVSLYDSETIYIEFKGKDAPLLIGKEGYRYKALSYILFNWINEKYSMMVRLEIAEFLKNQEEAISNYLIPVIEDIEQKGMAKTKPLDGVLVHIALAQLREKFPNKYVAIKTNIKGDKYVLVNEYRD